jgi:N-acetylglutamate synthase-like GNAT family acetyltransferase
MWQCNVGELYLLNSQVCMNFLDNVGFKLYGKDKLDAQIKKME